jgi:outer membrane protein TolC
MRSPVSCTSRPRYAYLAAAVLSLLTACASPDPERSRAAVQELSAGRTAGVDVELQAPAPNAAEPEPITGELTVEQAVRLALQRSPSAQQALVTLDLSDALRAQAGRLPNPHFGIADLAEGDARTIERVLRFDLVGLVLLPWKSQWQNQQLALAQLQAAQDLARLATDVRKAWVQAVAAEQSLRYLNDAQDAAEAGAELARRMQRAGNFNRLQQAREELASSEANTQRVRAQQRAVLAREQLNRLLGLWGPAAQYTLPDHLPALPATALASEDVEARALRERLDVRAAVQASEWAANSLGYVKTAGYLDGLTLSYQHESTVDGSGERSQKHGWGIELPLPIFDAGGARNARADALYRLSLVRVRAVAVQARSEARAAYAGWHSAWKVVQQYRQQMVPLRQTLSEETLLRYNGMLASPWELLSEIRQQSQTVAQAIEAERDFWLADADLQLSLTATSPGALQAWSESSRVSTSSSSSGGH